MCKPSYAPGNTIYRPGTAFSLCRHTSQLNGSGIGTIKISRVDAGIGQVIHHHLSTHHARTSARNKAGTNGINTGRVLFHKLNGATRKTRFFGSIGCSIPIQTIHCTTLRLRQTNGYHFSIAKTAYIIQHKKFWSWVYL